MAFPIDERVSCVVMRNNPLVNGESHFTASFGSSWFINCNYNFYCSNCCNGLYQTNKMEIWVKRAENWQGSHLNGVQLHQGWPTGHQSCLRGQTIPLGIPLTKVCLECIHCNLKECQRLNYTYNTYTHNTLNNLNDTYVGGVRDLTIQVM